MRVVLVNVVVGEHVLGSQMFRLAVAHVVLVFDVRFASKNFDARFTYRLLQSWSELRSSCLHTSHLSRKPRAEDIVSHL